MRGQIDGAQAELEANLAHLRADSGADHGLIARGEAQLGALIALQRQIDTASPVALAMIRAAVASSVAASSSLAQQARTASASSAQAAQAVELATASAAARSSVTSFEHDFYERKIFDRDLRFTSKEDEEAYRKREAETKRQIDDALKQNTPEGNLRAAELAAAQLKDAGAHGATANPAYADTLSVIENSRHTLATQIKNAAPHASASIPHDPLADLAPEAHLPSDLIATFQGTGVRADNSGAIGHGLTQSQPVPAASAGVSL